MIVKHGKKQGRRFSLFTPPADKTLNSAGYCPEGDELIVACGVSDEKVGEPASLINLAPVGYAGNVHRSECVVNFLHDAVVTHTNTPFVSAALEFRAA
jgi:hypothetical protein